MYIGAVFPPHQYLINPNLFAAADQNSTLCTGTGLPGRAIPAVSSDRPGTASCSPNFFCGPHSKHLCGSTFIPCHSYCLFLPLPAAPQLAVLVSQWGLPCGVDVVQAANASECVLEPAALPEHPCSSFHIVKGSFFLVPLPV